MGNALELTGQRFGRLIVESQNIIRSLSGGIRWNCICDCGNKVTVRSDALSANKTSSCGCIRIEIFRQNNTTHGMSKTPEHNSWHGMIQRCTNPNDQAYHNYGGRGITVCDRWLNSFEAFYEDMGPKPSINHSIDRKENDLGYYKENCRWATKVEQANNTRSNVFHEYKGQKFSLQQLADLPEAKTNGISLYTLTSRLYTLKWSIDKALNTPTKDSCFYTHNGITKTISEWSREYEVDYGNLYIRLINLNWGFEKAIITP